MRFSDFIILETQTISQYLKSGSFPPESIKTLKNIVRTHLSTGNFPFFRAEGMRLLDLFTSFFAYQFIFKYGQNNPNPNDTNWLTNLFARNLTTVFVQRLLDRLWTTWGDYVVNHANDSRKMSQFNTMEYTEDKVDKDVQDWHDRLALKQAKPGGEGTPILDVGNGWKWLSLNRGYCRQEGDAAGHCGNAAHKDGDNILSLRDPENKVHLTFIVNKKILGESKGRGNNKPSPKFHDAIIKLLQSPYIDFIRGGGYLPDHNFELTDLPEETVKQLIAQKPTLGMNYFDYVMKSQRGNLKTKIGNIINHEVKEVYRSGNITYVVLETFEDLAEIEEFLPKGSGRHEKNNVAWIDDIQIDTVQNDAKDLDDAISYYVPDEVTLALNKYLKTSPEYDQEEWDDMSLGEKIKTNDEIDDAFMHALFSGEEVGTGDEAWKDVKNQLGSPDKAGYFIDFDKHPWRLTISLNSLRDVYKDHHDIMEDGNNWIEESMDLSYQQPYNGYNDFDKDAFNERLLEELPKEVIALIKKKRKKFKEWLENT